MEATECDKTSACDLRTPRRNHYFFGKLLDQYHFELETDYHIYMRRLAHRFISGYGVVCGLDVKPACDADNAIVVTPGFAIDRHGNEIIVEEPTRPIAIPGELMPKHKPVGQKAAHAEEAHAHVVICYHECASEPTPVFAGDCCQQERCKPGVIRERYRIEFRPGCAPASSAELSIPDVISNCEVDYRALVKLVSRDCCCPDDPCIPLANLHFGATGDDRRCYPEDIDIGIRPIVFTNDLLFQLLMCLVTKSNTWRQK